MPQLEFATFPSQIFWLAISYGLIYLFVSKYITPTIFALKKEREDKIKLDSQKASLFISESEDIQKSLMSLRAELLEKESAILLESKKAFESNVQKEESKFDRKIKKSVQNAQISVNEEVKSVKEKLDELSNFHASFLIKKLIGKKVDEEVFKKLRKS